MDKNILTEPIEKTVGYMLKILKSGKQIIQFQKEFASIRHGNYYEFLNLIKGEIPFMVVFENGKIINENSPRREDCDFVGLMKSGPSLNTFYNNCFFVYGHIIDVDISDEIYGKVVLFEIGLRMHANNHNLLNEKEELVDVIDKIGIFKNLSQTEKDQLQLGRRFLNMIKHNRNQFPSWNDGINAFQLAYQILETHHLTVV